MYINCKLLKVYILNTVMCSHFSFKCTRRMKMLYPQAVSKPQWTHQTHSPPKTPSPVLQSLISWIFPRKRGHPNICNFWWQVSLSLLPLQFVVLTLCNANNRNIDSKSWIEGALQETYKMLKFSKYYTTIANFLLFSG